MKQLSFRSKQVMLISMLFFLFSLTAFSQARTISGTVKDQDNTPLPGVSVVGKGYNHRHTNQHRRKVLCGGSRREHYACFHFHRVYFAGSECRF